MISGEYGYHRSADDIDRMLDCKLLEKKVILFINKWFVI